MLIGHIDLETRATVDIGAIYVYAAHPETEIIVARWRIGDGPIRETWLFEDAIYLGLNNDHDYAAGLSKYWADIAELRDTLADPEIMWTAHNAGFERLLIKHCGRRYGLPEVPVDRWRCTAARAARCGLPRSLDGAAKALNLAVTKDQTGRRIMLQLCKPRRIEDGRPVWWDDVAKYRALSAYCATDVEVECLIDETLPPLEPSEVAVWCLNETMNDRGVAIDQDALRVLQAAADAAKAAANDSIAAKTGGRVQKVTNAGGLKSWLAGEGFDETTLSKARVAEMLADPEIPDHIREVLEIRADGGKSSVAKLDAMALRTQADGRARGNAMYHGASTGRFSGTGIQLQNVVRDVTRTFDADLQALRRLRGAEWIVGPIMPAISRMLRPLVRAAPGHELLFCDYSAVEARGTAWLAGDTKLVEAFRSGAPVYEQMAASIFRRTVAEIIALGKDSLERFTGKTTILGACYGMGPAKFDATCEAQGRSVGLQLAETAIYTFRDDHPKVPELWRDVERAAKLAIQNPGRAYQCAGGRAAFRMDKKGGWLRCRLPSGRTLFYCRPRLTQGPYGDQIEFEGVNSKTKRWATETTWGGKLVENIVQALCRDLMVFALLNLEAAGFNPVLTVHDEIICETPIGRRSVEEMIGVMTTPPDWAAGFPLAAEGKKALRYGK